MAPDPRAAGRGSDVADDPALLLIGHGTRSAAGAAECAALADRVRALGPGMPVATGFIELTAPPIPAAADELVAAGHDPVVAVPLVLLGAGHAKTDVPASLARARATHPGVTFRYGRHLGVHPDLLAVVDDRLDAVVPEGAAPGTGVLLAGRGSRDPDANADLAKVARLLLEGRDYPLVETAYVGLTHPDVAEGLDRLRRLGARRVAVVPYFLFTGVLEQRIHAQAADFAANHPDTDVTVAGYLGADDRVARLVLDRYHEALAGDTRMSCDTCIHRVALPGFADKVGAPQTPHHHPHG